MNLAEQINELLKGIDETETDSIGGWWETSTGAEFGVTKLKELLALLDVIV